MRHLLGKHWKRLLVIGPLALSGASQVVATDRTWNGSVNGQWSNTSNWNNGAIAGSEDTAILLTGASNRAIDLSGSSRLIFQMEIDSSEPYSINNGTREHARPATRTMDYLPPRSATTLT